MTSIRGRLVDLLHDLIIEAEVTIADGRIAGIRPLDPDGEDLPYIIPGFVDAHVHIESSLLVPAEFARLAVVHGTIATVSDPHEIANVCGLAGVEFMIANGRTVPFTFCFGAPSCVPATGYETAGAALDAAAVEGLLQRNEIMYLSEMMNFPGVLNKDPEVMQKIASAHALGKPVDGHAPGLRGETAKQYIDAGISTDHECFTAEEALDKLRYGMKILIREGSAAKNFDALIGLLNEYPDRMMFCSDDKHADSLVEGHIDRLCARAVARGIDPFKVLKAACLNPVLHYRLDTGLLRSGDPANLVLVKDLRSFNVLSTYIGGVLVAENGVSKIARRSPPPGEPINSFHALPRVPGDFRFAGPTASGHVASRDLIPVIGALDGQLITSKLMVPVANFRPAPAGFLHANPGKDLLKIAVVNRYRPAPVALAFIRNFGLKSGALASSVAHDSHNIVVVGADDESMCRAVNLIIARKGGLSCVNGEKEAILPLPVAGLMSMDDGYQVAEDYIALDAMVKQLGSTLGSPFMTLSFMALLVIPHLKLSDQGLFDGDLFQFLP
ncbi:MAG: adenine deaminase [Bacteroidota bacterium]|nr:adenine deaminase [Bacteroidota bacterium]